MEWSYCYRLMTWPHCERLNGMDSKTSCERSMEWNHCEYLNRMASKISFPPSPQLIDPSTPTYLLPDSSDRRPVFSTRLGGGGWCCYHFPLAHIRLHCYLHLYHQSGHLVRHQILRRSRGSVPPSFWYRFPWYFPSVPRETPNLHHHWMSIPYWVHEVPADPDVSYHCPLILSLHRRMWARVRPDAVFIWE